MMKHIFQGSSKSITDSRRYNTNKALTKPVFDKELFSVTTSLGTVSLFSLGIPILIETVLNRLLSTVNTVVLGGFSDDAVAAVGSVSTVLDLVSLFFYAVSTGATVLISNYIGGEQLSRAAKSVFSALITCIGLSVIFGFALFAASEPIIQILNLEGAVAQYGKIYFTRRALALPISAASSILYSVLRCYGYAKATVISGISSNAINLLLSVYVVYGSPPKLFEGVAGIAFACIISQLFSLIMGIVVFKIKQMPLAIPKIREFISLVIKILKIGIPGGLSSGSLTLSQVITTPFIATLGMSALSAKVYFNTILSYSYLFSYAMGTANSLLIGRLCGAGKYEHAHRLNSQLVKITVAVNFSVYILLLSLRVPLLSLFTDNDKIIKMSLVIFLIDIIAGIARAVSQVYEYALRAAGDVAFAMIAIIISCWVCGVGLNYVFTIPCGLGLAGVWMAVSLDETVRAVATFFRWKTDKWKKSLSIEK